MNSARKKCVYLASPLFNDVEREFNSLLAMRLGAIAEVFLPQRDGKLLRDLLKDGTPMSKARRAVYEADIAAIRGADFIVAVLDGRTVDEGVAFEIGYASALGKKCIGLKTDERMLLPFGDNPMIVEGCDKIVSNMEELDRVLWSLLGENIFNRHGM